MRRFIIERTLPGIGAADDGQLCAAARTSNRALSELGVGIQWIESFVASDKTFCVYLTADEQLIHRHAELSGFPATVVTEVFRVIDPTTATAPVRQGR